MLIIVLVICVSSLPLVRTDCSSFIHDIINCYGLYDVSPTQSPDSILTFCDQYYPMCNAVEGFLSCYLNAFYTCDDYKTYNPTLFDEITIKTMLLGCCDNKHIFDEGKECVGTFYINLHYIVTYSCFSFDDISKNGFRAVSSSNWTGFCRDMDERYDCIQSIIRPLNCSTEYYETAKHLYHAILPPPCQNKSDVFHWINHYVLNSSNSKTLSILLFVFLCFVCSICN